MDVLFYLSAAVAGIATLLMLTRTDAVHAVLYLVIALLSIALIFFVLGAYFAAALEVIIYAGAIMILFLFVIMMLNLGTAAAAQERRWMRPGVWIGPGLLACILLFEITFVLASGMMRPMAGPALGIKAVGITLFGPYLLAVELASFVLTVGLVAAYHLGRREVPPGTG